MLSKGFGFGASNPIEMSYSRMMPGKYSLQYASTYLFTALSIIFLSSSVSCLAGFETSSSYMTRFLRLFSRACIMRVFELVVLSYRGIFEDHKLRSWILAAEDESE